MTNRHWVSGSALALALAVMWPSSARADLDGLEPLMKGAEIIVPDLGIVLDADSPNLALAVPVQVHLWQRKGACDRAGCPYRPWLAALIEPQWASGGHGFALLAGLRAYFPLRQDIGSGAPSFSVDLAAAANGGGIGFAVGGGPSLEATPFMQALTPRYRYVWSAHPRHELYLDLFSFGWGAKS